jgi:hypothetical protein
MNQSASPDPTPVLERLAGVLQSVVKQLREPLYLLVIGVSVIIVILTFGVIWLAPDISGPLYAAMIVIGVLALVALLGGIVTGLVTAILKARGERSAPPDETPAEEAKPSQPEQPEFFVPFQNRNDEIKYITSSFAPPYFLLDAPAGYGKSVLLQRLAKEFKEDDWLVAHIRADERSNIYQLATELIDQLEVECPLRGDVEAWGMRLAGILNTTCFSNGDRGGLVFLIDLDKRPALPIFKDLLDQFIPAVYKGLSVHEFFSSRHNRFRAILSGRYLAGQEEIAPRATSPTVLRLTPFDYDVVRETVRALLPQHDNTTVIQLAAHLMFFTGGHPGCMAYGLQRYKQEGGTPESFLQLCLQDMWPDSVRPVVQDMRDNVSRNLRPALDRLSVFRYLDYPLMDVLTGTDRPVVAGYKSGKDLIDRLMGTYLLSWQQRLLRDDILRRLLAIRLREEEAQFPEWCRQAQSTLADHLQRQQTQLPERWAIEYLYQVLQEHAGVIHEYAQRSELRTRFFEEEVPKVIGWLGDAHPKTHVFRHLGQAINDDWEFRFTANYFMRIATYSDEPCQRLRGQVDDLLSTAPDGKEQDA